MVKKTLFIVAVFIGFLICAVGIADSQYKTSIGHKAPALWLPKQPGAPATSLKDNLGSYVLLTFWKSTDPSSRKEVNEYTAWLRHHRDDVTLLAVNLEKSPQLFEEIMRQDSLIVSTQYHVSGELAQLITDEYGLDKGLGSMLINPSGKIVSHNPTIKDLDEMFPD